MTFKGWCPIKPKETNNQPRRRRRRRRRNLQNSRLCCPGGPQNKTEECEKKDKHVGLARELKKQWNMKVTILSIVIGAFGTVTKELLKGLENLEVGGRVETIKTTALLRTARILRRVLKTWRGLLSLQWETLSTHRYEKPSKKFNKIDWFYLQVVKCFYFYSEDGDKIRKLWPLPAGRLV